MMILHNIKLVAFVGDKEPLTWSDEIEIYDINPMPENLMPVEGPDTECTFWEA